MAAASKRAKSKKNPKRKVSRTVAPSSSVKRKKPARTLTTKPARSTRKQSPPLARPKRSLARSADDFLTLLRRPERTSPAVSQAKRSAGILPIAVEQEMPKAILSLDGELLAGTLHQPLSESKTLIIAAHGFLSNRRQLLIRQSCIELARAGFCAYRFDFSGNGDSEGRFEDATPKKMLRDLTSVVEYFRKDVRYTKLILLGHSLGGAMSLMAAARLNVHGLICINAPAHLERVEQFFNAQQLEQMRSVGFAIITLPTSVGPVPYTVTERFMTEVRELAPIAAARDVHCPALLICGTSDRLVPTTDAGELAGMLYAKEVSLIGGADHNLAHPEHLDAAIAGIIGWLRKTA